MKRSIFIVFVIFVSLLLSFCSKKEEIYSCDPKVNDFVVTNKSSFDTLTRSELFLNYTLPYQKAIYRSLHDSIKCNFWKEKLDTLLLENWSFATATAIEDIRDELDIDFFSSEIESSRAIVEDFIDDIVTISEMDTLDVIHNFYTIATAYEIDEWTDEDPGGGGANDCDCRWSMECIMLSLGRCEDDKDNCVHTNSDCGAFWLYPCTGLCEYDPPPTY